MKRNSRNTLFEVDAAARICTRRARLVTDAAFAAGRVDAGRYVTVCGIVVLPASLTTPEASYCASCAYWRRHGNRAGAAPKLNAGMVADGG